MKNYNLIDGLFSTKPTQIMVANSSDEKEKSQTTKRTFKINNEFWNDFVTLAAARRLTQMDLLNKLIENAVQENREEIEKYQAFFKNK